EAISHLEAGLALLKHLPETPDRIEQELGLQLALAGVLTATEGYSARRTGDAYSRAKDLSEQITGSLQIYPALYGIWNYLFVGSRMKEAREIAERYHYHSQDKQDSTLLLAGHSMLGQTLTVLGQFESACRHSEKSFSLYEPERDRHLALTYGEHPAIVAASFHSWALWLLGYPDQALERSEAALAEAREMKPINSLSLALSFSGAVHRWRGEPQSVLPLSVEVAALSGEQRLPFWPAEGLALKGWPLVVRGELEEGVRVIWESQAAWQD